MPQWPEICHYFFASWSGHTFFAESEFFFQKKENKYDNFSVGRKTVWPIRIKIVKIFTREKKWYDQPKRLRASPHVNGENLHVNKNMSAYSFFINGLFKAYEHQMYAYRTQVRHCAIASPCRK